jgi:hypothetical protein
MKTQTIELTSEEYTALATREKACEVRFLRIAQSKSGGKVWSVTYEELEKEKQL